MIKKLTLTLTLFSSLVLADALNYDFEKSSLQNWSKNGKWEILAEKENKILSLSQHSRDYFNLCYTKDVAFTDGSISVKFRANSGHMDQGGGLMWRVQDNDNYYVARFNPLEDNFRFYIVHEGMRSELDSATIKLSSGWHTMKIVQKGTHFEGYLDDKKLVIHEDKQLQKSGGVGVWTKADALTSFDDLHISTDK